VSRPHGNTGKKNALKEGEALDARVAFRLPASVKDQAERAAKKEGLSASQWYLRAINKAL